MAANLKAVWPMNLSAPAGSLEAKQPEADDGLDVPDPSRYYSREFMEKEWKFLWPRVWLLAGVTPDVPEECDYTVFNHGHESFVVVRQEDGGIRAFYNACPHRADLKDISRYATVSNSAYKIMKRLLPGPYTFVLEGTRLVPKIMLTKRKTAGIRVPDNPICLALVKELGHPIITTSAMLPGGEALYDPADIDRHLGKSLDLVIDGGVLVSEPSSVIDLTERHSQDPAQGEGGCEFF